MVSPATISKSASMPARKPSGRKLASIIPIPAESRHRPIKNDSFFNAGTSFYILVILYVYAKKLDKAGI